MEWWKIIGALGAGFVGGLVVGAGDPGATYNRGHEDGFADGYTWARWKATARGSDAIDGDQVRHAARPGGLMDDKAAELFDDARRGVGLRWQWGKGSIAEQRGL